MLPGSPAVVRARGRVDQQPGGLELGGHLGQGVGTDCCSASGAAERLPRSPTWSTAASRAACAMPTANAPTLGRNRSSVRIATGNPRRPRRARRSPRPARRRRRGGRSGAARAAPGARRSGPRRHRRTANAVTPCAPAPRWCGRTPCRRRPRERWRSTASRRCSRHPSPSRLRPAATGPQRRSRPRARSARTPPPPSPATTPGSHRSTVSGEPDCRIG